MKTRFSVARRHRAAEFPASHEPAAMPGFADKLNDEQVAALVSYLRAAGVQKPDVTAATVRALR
jgi:mono/diheme cytochrome c family protein